MPGTNQSPVASRLVVALIPARYAASRFPGKLMQPLGEKPVIRHTYDNTVATGLFGSVVVVTDSPEIFDEIESHGGNALLSKKEHECGTDRIAEAAAVLNADIILNVQGDTPFVKKEPLEKLLRLFDDPLVEVASMMQVLPKQEDIENPNIVKVITDRQGNALYFSRSVIPFLRDKTTPVTYYEHIGVYAFRKQALLQFTQWPIATLEAAEKIECLRFLENGIMLRMALVDYMGVGIDVPADLEKAKRLIL